MKLLDVLGAPNDKNSKEGTQMVLRIYGDDRVIVKLHLIMWVWLKYGQNAMTKLGDPLVCKLTPSIGGLHEDRRSLLIILVNARGLNGLP